MNRLRHAYLEISPGLEPVSRDGPPRRRARSVRDVWPGHGSRFYRLIGETSTLVAVINAALAGAVVGLVANAAGTGSELASSSVQS